MGRPARFLILQLGFLLLIASSTSVAHAVDEVVLTDGSIFQGTVLNRSESDVTVKGRFGIATFSVQQLRAVRQNGEVWRPGKLSPAGDLTLEKEAEPEVTVRVQEHRRERLVTLKKELSQSLTAIEANPLGYWERHSPESVAGPIEGAFRIRRAGQDEFTDKTPSAEGDIEVLWVCQRERDKNENSANESRVYHWVPLYWNPTQKRWLESPPAYASFTWEQSQVARWLQRLLNAADADNPACMWILCDKLQRTSTAADRAKAETELRAAAKSIVQPWNGDDELYEVFRTCLAIAKVDEREKVDLARKRRSQLRRLLAQLPGDAELAATR